MKLIIAGGRDFNDYELLKRAVDFYLSKTDKRDVIIISGCARGADSLGERYAHENSMELWKFPADWDKHGKAAGHIRNTEMAEVATHLIAFPGGRGTKNMIQTAQRKGLRVRMLEGGRIN